MSTEPTFAEVDAYVAGLEDGLVEPILADARRRQAAAHTTGPVPHLREIIDRMLSDADVRVRDYGSALDVWVHAMETGTPPAEVAERIRAAYRLSSESDSQS